MVVLYRENREDDEQIWFNPDKIFGKLPKFSQN